jgi:polynucleotide 5'-kinase involved in rRNA processing
MGLLLLVGPVDAGKTTLSRALLARREGFLLDLDVGQGSLPGALSLFQLREGRWVLLRRYLVGALSPRGLEAEVVAGSARLRRLLPEGAFAVADTDGLLDERLRLLQAEALLPEEVWVLGDQGLYRALAWRQDFRVRLFSPLKEARRKTAEKRRRARTERLLAHLGQALPRVLPYEGEASPRLFGLLDGEGFLLGYARLLAVGGGEGLFLTPVRGEVARVLPTRIPWPSPALPG